MSRKCTQCGASPARGNPALCGDCFVDDLRAGANSVFDRFLDRALDRGAQALDKGVDRVVGRIDAYAQRFIAAQTTPGTGAPGASQPKGPSPREIMHFGPDEPLTAQKIKDRKRQLAKICHPDTGTADPAGMAQINEAADALLKEIG